jgi:hypothetical protein
MCIFGILELDQKHNSKIPKPYRERVSGFWNFGIGV